jgi:hypothetical protein
VQNDRGLIAADVTRLVWMGVCHHTGVWQLPQPGSCCSMCVRTGRGCYHAHVSAE